MAIRNYLLYPAIGLIGVCVVFVTVYLLLPNSRTTILLVRHAEKEPNGNNPNPNLSNHNDNNGGQARAQALVAVAQDAGVTAIYTTEYCRTAQTAQPLARQLGLPLIVQDNRPDDDYLSDCEPEIEDEMIQLLPQDIDTIAELVDEVLSGNAGKVVLLVGHSNTVPQIVEELGADPLCPDYFPFDPMDKSCKIPDDQFDNLFIVTVPRFFGDVKIVKAKYDD